MFEQRKMIKAPTTATLTFFSTISINKELQYDRSIVYLFDFRSGEIVNESDKQLQW